MHNNCPPPPANATQEEINQLYWEWCYRPIDTIVDNNDAPCSGSSPPLTTMPALAKS